MSYAVLQLDYTHVVPGAGACLAVELYKPVACCVTAKNSHPN